MSKGMVWLLALVASAMVLCLGVTVVWLTGDLRVVGFVVMGMGVIAAGLVQYFEWRSSLRRRIIADAQDVGGRREESRLTLERRT